MTSYVLYYLEEKGEKKVWLAINKHVLSTDLLKVIVIAIAAIIANEV
jgi:hypothetical protein